jgi:hypothetical protein
VPDISVADEGQAVSVQTFTRTAGVITDSFVAGDVLHIGIGDGVNAPVCYIELSSASPATGTMAINTVGMVALFAATSANQLTLNVGVVRTRGGNTNTIFSAPIVIHRSVIDPDTAVPTPSILGTGVAAALKVAINTALGFVRLDASARYPALDGSQITNLAGGSLTVGTTAIASGTSGRILYDNAGVLGELPVGTGVATALAVNVGSAGAFITFNGDAGTPSALVGTNISGTAASLTAGLVSSIGDLTGDVTSSNRATTLATVNANVGSFTNASVTVNAKGLVTAASSGTAAVTSITGTANEITVTGTTTPTLSLPSALTFTGKTVTGGTFNAAQLRADTTSATAVTGESSTDGTGVGGRTVSGTALSGSATGNGTALSGYSASGKLLSLSGDAGENFVVANNGQLTLGGFGPSGIIVLNGSASGSSTITVSATGVLALPTGTTAPNLTLSATTSLLLGTAGSAVGNVGFRNATSGTTTLAPATGALGTGTVTLPLSGTLAISSGAQTFTGVQSMASPDITTSITTPSTTFALVNATATTLNIGGAATTANLFAANATVNLAGGATINGGTAANDDITIQGTSNATRTTSYVILQPTEGNVGICTTTPSYRLTIPSINSEPVLCVTQPTSATHARIAVRNYSAGDGAASGSLGLDVGISGAANAFFTGTSAGDMVIKAYSQANTKKLFIGATNAATAQITLDPGGTAVAVTGSMTVSTTLAVTGASTLTGLLTANGGITLGDAQNIAFNTTTGTKIGTATTQKLSFWNSTPIVQPTTAVGSATIASPGGGTNLKTDDTFDGYTIAQVVKALRNAGLLA